jgi:hypothetical protein
VPARSIGGEGTRVYLKTPAVTWDQLVPYLKANVVPSMGTDGMDVFVCTGAVDSTVVERFYRCTSDFAKNLQLEALQSDEPLQEAFSRQIELFKKSVARMPATEVEKAQVHETLWQGVLGDEAVAGGLRRHFERAAHDGTMRCTICEQDASLRPCGVQRAPE